MELIRLFVGYDTREAIAFDVFTASVVRRTTRPVAITPLALRGLERVYVEAHQDGSNQFIYSRFLVPYLCNYEGWAIFCDGDMLCRADLDQLWELRDPTKAVQVVKHDYKTKHPFKYLGARNDDYPRKNWSSVILWNCGHPANECLRPELVVQQPGSYLHRFTWLDDDLIGSLPPEWNHLVDEQDYDPGAKIAHYTLGTPCFRGYSRASYASGWYAELFGMLYVPDASEGYAKVFRSASLGQIERGDQQCTDPASPSTGDTQHAKESEEAGKTGTQNQFP